MRIILVTAHQTPTNTFFNEEFRYDKLMVYLIALALGTMATLTFFQLIPEAIDIYHSHKVVIPCSHANEYQLLEGQPYSLVISRAGGGPSVPGDGLISNKNDSYYEGDLCYLKFAGPKMYIWEMLTVFCMVILFYNIQVKLGPRDYEKQTSKLTFVTPLKLIYLCNIQISIWRWQYHTDHMISYGVKVTSRLSLF